MSFCSGVAEISGSSSIGSVLIFFCAGSTDGGGPCAVRFERIAFRGGGIVSGSDNGNGLGAGCENFEVDGDAFGDAARFERVVFR